MLTGPPKAWQLKTRPNCDAPGASATETGWDPTLVQSKEKIEVEICKPMQCPTRRFSDVYETPPNEQLSINFDRTDF